MKDTQDTVVDVKSMADRIKSARKQKGFTQAQAAEAAGMPKRTYETYERGEIKSPSVQKSQAIARALDIPRLLPDQNDGGNGGPPRVREDVRGYDGGGLDDVFDRLQLVRIPHMTVEAEGGSGAPNEWERVNGETIYTKHTARRLFNADPARVVRITATGDSMEPTVCAGDYLYVVMLHGEMQTVEGSIYVLQGPHGLRIKRLYWRTAMSEAEGHEEVAEYAVLRSDREDVPDERFPVEAFHRDYVVRAVVRRIEKPL